MAKKQKAKAELTVALWVVDGFVGILALMIYNFLLYLLTAIGIKSIIGEMENTMGYFGLNSFISFGFGPGEIIIGMLLFFVVAFLLGILVGKYVRKKKS